LDWKKYFGNTTYAKISTYLDQMCFADSEINFTTAYENAKKHVSGKNLEYLMRYGEHPELFASYKLREYPGNLGRHGSSHSEQNHSSIVRNIGSCLLTEPHDTVKYFMQRQGLLLNKINALLTKNVMNAEGKSRSMSAHDERRLPIKLLSSWGYLLWEEESSHSKLSSTREEFTLTDGQRCSCSKRLSFFIQCRHELSFRQFDISQWAKRWHQRDQLWPSLLISIDSGIPSMDDDVEVKSTSLEVSLPDSGNLTQDVSVNGQGALVNRNKLSMTRQQSYGYLQRAYNPVFEKACKKNDTAYIVGGFASVLDARLSTGLPFTQNEIGEWVSRINALGPNSQFSFITQDASNIPSRVIQVGRPNQKRFKSVVEVHSSKAKLHSCRFCKDSGHNIASCPNALKYGKLNTANDSSMRLTMRLNDHALKQNGKVSAGTKHTLPQGIAFLALEELVEDGVRLCCIQSGGIPIEGWSHVVCHVTPVLGWVSRYGKGCVFSNFSY